MENSLNKIHRDDNIVYRSLINAKWNFQSHKKLDTVFTAPSKEILHYFLNIYNKKLGDDIFLLMFRQLKRRNLNVIHRL